MSTDNNPDDRGGGVLDDRAERLRQIIHDYIVRRASGEVIPERALLDAHPGLESELSETLRGLRLVDSAIRLADEGAVSKSPGLRIRCPHCHNPMELSDDTHASEMTCHSCGDAFGLVDEKSPLQKDMLMGHFELLDKLGFGAFWECLEGT